MQPSLERVHFGTASFLMFERRESLTPFWHYHPEFQITLMVDGEGRRFIGSEISTYGPGDLVLIGSNLPHTWQSNSLVRKSSREQYAIDVQFRSDFLVDSLLFSEELRPIKTLLERSKSGIAFGHTAGGRRAGERLAMLPSLSTSRRAIGILDILLDLAMISDSSTLSERSARQNWSSGDGSCLEEMCAYLTAHFDQEIDFGAMAKQFRRSRASLCHVFKRTTGRTMTDFVNELRVNAAARMLSSSAKGLAEIAFCVGFGNYSHFNHQFKRFKGVSPNAWRNQN